MLTLSTQSVVLNWVCNQAVNEIGLAKFENSLVEGLKRLFFLNAKKSLLLTLSSTAQDFLARGSSGRSLFPESNMGIFPMKCSVLKMQPFENYPHLSSTNLFCVLPWFRCLYEKQHIFACHRFVFLLSQSLCPSVFSYRSELPWHRILWLEVLEVREK